MRGMTVGSDWAAVMTCGIEEQSRIRLRKSSSSLLSMISSTMAETVGCFLVTDLQ